MITKKHGLLSIVLLFTSLYGFSQESFVGADWIRETRFLPQTPCETFHQLACAVEITKKAGKHPVIAVDLDETLYTYNERTRTAIVDWAKNAPEPYRALAQLILSSPRLQAQRTLWNLEKIIKEDCGWDVNPLAFQDLVQHFHRLVFTDSLIHLDDQFLYGREHIQALHNSGATIIYLTSRYKDLMEEGTARRLQEDNFPWDDGITTHLMMRTVPRSIIAAEMKTQALIDFFTNHPGVLIAAIDNEPSTVVKLAETFPEAMVIFMHSDCGTKPARLVHDRLHIVTGFPPPPAAHSSLRHK